jgi:RNA polymerase sigma factor (sigma-70 family)
MTDTTKHAAGSAMEPPSTKDPNQCAPDDVELLARVRAGDERACEALVRQHGGRMLAVARRFLRTEEDSADAVQDAFLSAFRALESFEGNSAIGTWLHRIVVNVCLMRLRARSRSREVRIADLLPTFDQSGHHSSPVRAWRTKRSRGSPGQRPAPTSGPASTDFPMLTERFSSCATSRNSTPNRRPSIWASTREPSRRNCTAPAKPSERYWSPLYLATRRR